MLRIWVELVPGGMERLGRQIASATIVNVGGDPLSADYRWRADFDFLRVRELPAKALGQETLDGETVTQFTAVDRYDNARTSWLTDDGIALGIVRTARTEESAMRLHTTATE